jgi:hypothetical protein
LRDKYRAIRILSDLFGLQRTRRAVAAVAADIESGESSLLADIAPQPFGHPWDEGVDKL